MVQLSDRVREFQDGAFKKHQKLYNTLQNGQDPKVLFITCSDSRVVPHHLLQALPGEIFPIRVAGNIVPPYLVKGGVSATIEYALTALNIEHVVVCGHSQCGAMQGLLNAELIEGMPAVQSWLAYAPHKTTLENGRIPGSSHSPLEKTIAENVLLQLEHLQSHPSVQAKLKAGSIKLHGWVFAFETGNVLAYCKKSKRFEPLVSSQSAHSNTPLVILSSLALIVAGVSSALALAGLIGITTACLAILTTFITAGSGYTASKVGLFSCSNAAIMFDKAEECPCAQI